MRRAYIPLVLYDKARIFVQAGGGGNGVVSFRREAHVPHGGPDGGDGGRGGDVTLVCDDSLRDLQTYKRRAHYKSTRAGHGEGDLRHGANGPVLEIPLPPGTPVTSFAGTVQLFDRILKISIRPPAVRTYPESERAFATEPVFACTLASAAVPRILETLLRRA